MNWDLLKEFIINGKNEYIFTHFFNFNLSNEILYFLTTFWYTNNT